VQIFLRESQEFGPCYCSFLLLLLLFSDLLPTRFAVFILWKRPITLSGMRSFVLLLCILVLSAAPSRFVSYIPPCPRLTNSLSFLHRAFEPDQAALLAIWSGFADNPSTWNTTNELCGQTGVYCDGGHVTSLVYRFWCNSGRIIFCRASTTFRTTKKNNSTNYFTNSCPPALIFTPADAPDEAASNCAFRIVGG